MKKSAVIIMALMAFVPAVVAMLPIAGLHTGQPASGSSLPALGLTRD